jgi:hypothetical protein
VERVIRRYSNRKLYDPVSRATVTLEDITAMVGGGEDVVVVDAVTGQDVTFPILAKALAKLAGKHGYPRAWRDALRSLLQDLLRERSGRLWETLKHRRETVIESVEGSVARILRQSEVPLREEVNQLRRSVAELSHMVSALARGSQGEEVTKP